MAYTTASSTDASISFGRIFKNAFAGVISAYARQRAYTRTFKELSQLSSRELNDIGITRDMIHDVSRAEAERN